MSAPFPYTVLALEGFDADGAPMSIIAMEWPERWKPLADKQAKERQHLERFQHDVRLITGGDWYSDVEQAAAGKDPPDFTCVHAGSKIGLELSQLTLASRLRIDARFRRFAQGVMASDHNRLRHLIDRAVLVFFEKEDAEIPTTTKRITAVVSELRRYRPIDSVIAGTTPPAQLDMGAVHQFAGGTLTSSPLQSRSDTPFYRMMGFELALSHTTQIGHADAWRMLEKLVSDHDAAGVDHLLLSAGAPTANGFAYPSDSIVSQAIIGQANGHHLITRHIQTVILHDWVQKTIWTITPDQLGAEELGRVT